MAIPFVIAQKPLSGEEGRLLVGSVSHHTFVTLLSCYFSTAVIDSSSRCFLREYERVHSLPLLGEVFASADNTQVHLVS